MSMNPFKNLRKRMAEAASKFQNEDQKIVLLEDQSDGIFNVYTYTDSPEISIFMNVPDNRATMSIELGEGEFLSSERLEDWDKLFQTAPYWTVTLRQIETLYRNTVEELIEGEML